MHARQFGSADQDNSSQHAFSLQNSRIESLLKEITVKDDGIGIPPERLQCIFDIVNGVCAIVGPIEDLAGDRCPRQSTGAPRTTAGR